MEMGCLGRKWAPCPGETEAEVSWPLGDEIVWHGEVHIEVWLPDPLQGGTCYPAVQTVVSWKPPLSSLQGWPQSQGASPWGLHAVTGRGGNKGLGLWTSCRTLWWRYLLTSASLSSIFKTASQPLLLESPTWDSRIQLGAGDPEILGDHAIITPLHLSVSEFTEIFTEN